MAKKTGRERMEKRDEAERIYHALFRADIPPEIKDRYYRAIPALFSRPSHQEDQVNTEMLKSVSDLEALELAARTRSKMPSLVVRFRLMLHLAENLPANQDVFINFSDRRIHSIFSLALGSIRTLYKYIKGWFLLRRIGDV
jgi:hypothetical protein